MFMSNAGETQFFSSIIYKIGGKEESEILD